MKPTLILLGLLSLLLAPAQARCKDCGCKEKCSPKCRCVHEEKPKAR